MKHLIPTIAGARLVVVLALRELHPRNSGWNELAKPIADQGLHRCTRRYCSQREQFHQRNFNCLNLSPHSHT